MTALWSKRDLAKVAGDQFEFAAKIKTAAQSSLTQTGGRALFSRSFGWRAKLQTSLKHEGDGLARKKNH